MIQVNLQAWAKEIPILGLYAKGEQAGLMRKMVHWEYNYMDLIQQVDSLAMFLDGKSDVFNPGRGK